MRRYVFIVLAALMLFGCSQRKIVISDVTDAGGKVTASGAVDSPQKK